MRLILVRHGHALSGPVDRERPLSPMGRTDILGLGKHLSGTGLKLNGLFHSGYLRAQETAEILADLLSIPRLVEQVVGFTPNDSPHGAAEAICEIGLPALMVSHLPLLPELVSILVGHDQTKHWIEFQPGTAISLRHQGGSSWTIEWLLPPQI